MERPWVPEGDGTRCRAHDVLFPRGRVCDLCVGSPAAVDDVAEDAAEATYTLRVAAVESALTDQAARWSEAERNLLRLAANARKPERVTALIRAAALSADVARKAWTEAASNAKVLARVSRTAAMRRERLTMRKGHSH